MADTEHTPTKSEHAADHATAAAKKTAEEHAANVKKRLADEKTAREKAQKDHAKMVADVKPTPTQEENDMAASGVHVEEHEADGSPPDAHVTPDVYGTLPHNKKLEADRTGGGYSTRAATPKA
jgi:hypothetical protein